METLTEFRPTSLETVRCLECAEVYVKPTRGGTLSTNPGCPHCGYVGWSPVSVSLTAARRRDRFASNRLQRLLALAG